MSADESENLEYLVNGEAASATELELLDEMALQLVEGVSTELRKGFTCTAETGANFLALASLEVVPDEALVGKPSVMLEFSRSGAEVNLFEVYFTPKNELERLWFSTDEDLVDAAAVAQELIDSPHIDEDIKPLIKHVRKLITHSLGEVDESFEIETLQDSRNMQHFADVTRHLINAKCNVPVINRCYEKRLDDGRTLAIVQKELAALDVELGPEWDELPALLVTLVDTAAGSVYSYEKTLDGTTSLEVHGSASYTGSAGRGLEDTDDEFTDGIVGNYMEKITEAKVNADAAFEVIGALGYAAVVEEEEKARQESGVEEPWVYPELSFGFNINSASSAEDVVRTTLRALSAAAQYYLPEFCPEGFPMQPNYSLNSRQQVRVQKYLTQTVATGISDLQLQRHRGAVVDINQAVQAVLDELAVENHPVAQAVAQLHNEYSDILSHNTLAQVTTEVVSQTHWPLLRARLAKQSDEWRAALTVNA